MIAAFAECHTASYIVAFIRGDPSIGLLYYCDTTAQIVVILGN